MPLPRSSAASIESAMREVPEPRFVPYRDPSTSASSHLPHPNQTYQQCRFSRSPSPPPSLDPQPPPRRAPVCGQSPERHRANTLSHRLAPGQTRSLAVDPRPFERCRTIDFNRSQQQQFRTTSQFHHTGHNLIGRLLHRRHMAFRGSTFLPCGRTGFSDSHKLPSQCQPSNAVSSPPFSVRSQSPDSAPGCSQLVALASVPETVLRRRTGFRHIAAGPRHTAYPWRATSCHCRWARRKRSSVHGALQDQCPADCAGSHQ